MNGAEKDWLLLITVSVAMLGFASTAFWLMAGAFLYGMGTGLFSPAVSAWTADLSDEQHRGRGMATMYIALEAGIGLGAMAAGWIFRDRLSLIPPVFYGCAAVSMVGYWYLFYRKKPSMNVFSNTQ